MQSYIMSLIEVARRPGMISFATGLPDRRLFDPAGIEAAAEKVLESEEEAKAAWDEMMKMYSEENRKAFLDNIRYMEEDEDE